jgi:hypothetical protein
MERWRNAPTNGGPMTPQPGDFAISRFDGGYLLLLLSQVLIPGRNGGRYLGATQDRDFAIKAITAMADIEGVDAWLMDDGDASALPLTRRRLEPAPSNVVSFPNPAVAHLVGQFKQLTPASQAMVECGIKVLTALANLPETDRADAIAMLRGFHEMGSDGQHTLLDGIEVEHEVQE